MFVSLFFVGMILVVAKVTSVVDISWWYVTLPFVIDVFVFMNAFINDAMTGLE